MTTLRQALLLGDGGVISLVGSGGKTSLMFRLAHELSRAGETVLTTTTTKILEPEPAQSSCLIVSDKINEALDQAAASIDEQPHITMAYGKHPKQGKLMGFSPEIIDTIWKSRHFKWIIVEADGARGRPLKAPADHEPVVPACTNCVVGLIGLDGIGQPLDERWVFRPERFAALSGLSSGSDVTEAAVATALKHENSIFKNAPDKAARIVFLNQTDTPNNVVKAERLAHLLTESNVSGLNRVVIGQTNNNPAVLEIYEVAKGIVGRR